MLNREIAFERLESRCLLTGIVNGGFDSQFASSGAGWDAVGDLQVREGRAIFREDPVLPTRLEQAFVMPSGASELQFVVRGLQLDRSDLQPPDVYEVALLDASTLEPLITPLADVAGADAFVSFDAVGRIFFGAETSVPGAGASGESSLLAFPLSISVDVSAIPANTEALLIFELIGFGQIDSTVIIDEVQLIGDLPPQITLGLDPDTDTGLQGDNFTQLTTINLIGRGPVGQTIELDLDGDGFDDGGATVDASGNYRFSDLSLNAETTFRVRAANSFGETILDRVLTPDTAGPDPEITAPALDALLTADPGFLEVAWDDAGQAGVNLETLDPSDVLIDGVDVDRIEVLSSGRVRYWYGDDGDVLPYGPVDVRFAANVVEDLAGNANGLWERQLNHALLSCGWQNVQQPVDTTGDEIVSSMDVLVVINEINRRGSTLDAATLPPLPPLSGDFFWYDVQCDGLITPSDVLLVINYINQRPA